MYSSVAINDAEMRCLYSIVNNVITRNQLQDIYVPTYIIAHVYAGYADNITLTCPSIYGLICMLDICNQFAKNNHVTFNTKKTIIMYTILWQGSKTRRMCYAK